MANNRSPKELQSLEKARNAWIAQSTPTIRLNTAENVLRQTHVGLFVYLSTLTLHWKKV
jgi:hypothetical protein